jgi:hypothetical protein
VVEIEDIKNSLKLCSTVKRQFVRTKTRKEDTVQNEARVRRHYLLSTSKHTLRNQTFGPSNPEKCNQMLVYLALVTGKTAD